MATDEIRAIVVKYEEEHLNFEEFPEMFSKMSNLSFQPKELVQLGLPHGTFEYLWEGVMHSVKLNGVAFTRLFRYLQGLLCRLISEFTGNDHLKQPSSLAIGDDDGVDNDDGDDDDDDDDDDGDDDDEL
nr:hypothetical protein CFP56_15556 [Quercus suber]